MEKLQIAKEFLIQVIASVLKGDSLPDAPNDLSYKALTKLAYKNSVQSLLYFAFQDEKNFPTDLLEKLKNSYLTSVLRLETQNNELKLIRKDFNTAGIDFMPLKGSFIKELYPLPELRFMSDIDILVRAEKVNDALAIIKSHGFSLNFDNGKDVVMSKKPFLTIELHNSLFQDDYFMHDYFKSVWERAVNANTHEYKMSINDLYVYVLAHLAEHYTSAGSLFRPCLDLFVLKNKYSNEIDFNYINTQFEIIGIANFANNINHLICCWFEDGEYTDDIMLMETYILLGPPVERAAEVSKSVLQESNVSNSLIKTIFPGYRHMSTKYHILKKFPYLLPIFWLIRAFEFTFKDFSKSKTKLENIISVDDEDKDKMKEIFKRSGL